MQLTHIIQRKIADEGPISFRDFMELALYAPDSGYYTSAAEKIGPRGDYYTSPVLTPAFGEMVGRQIEEMWIALGRKAFTIVEYGAGTGQLCRTILDYLAGNPPLYEALRYCIIEKSPAMRTCAATCLPEEKVTWHDSIRELSGISGCVLSNELVDNFAVHQVVMEEELMEVFVAYENGFTEVLQPAGEALRTYLAELNVRLPKGFRTEINLQATEWLGEIAACLEKGYVLTIDYGHTSDRLYHQRRSNGTLICYHRHAVNDSPYSRIGEQDITAHVNFSALCHWGRKHGLRSCGLTSQADFLLALGWKQYLEQTLLQGKDLLQRIRSHSLLTHTLLIDMGDKFNVLIQRKGRVRAKLTGMQHARLMQR